MILGNAQKTVNFFETHAVLCKLMNSSMSFIKLIKM